MLLIQRIQWLVILRENCRNSMMLRLLLQCVIARGCEFMENKSTTIAFLWGFVIFNPNVYCKYTTWSEITEKQTPPTPTQSPLIQSETRVRELGSVQDIIRNMNSILLFLDFVDLMLSCALSPCLTGWKDIDLARTRWSGSRTHKMPGQSFPHPLYPLRAPPPTIILNYSDHDPVRHSE